VGRLFIVVALVGSSLGCAPTHTAPDGVICCPLVHMRGGAGTVTYGGIAGLGRFERDTCLELFHDGTRLAHTDAIEGGQFALQFVIPGRLDALTLELHATPAGRPTERLGVSLTAESGARITYVRGTTPLVATDSGRLRFRGTLDGAPFERILAAWVINWTTGNVEPIVPPPETDVAFDAFVPGGPFDYAAPASLHDGRAGGCWWPRGGGGRAPPCTIEMLEAGTCFGVVPPCTTPRGCEPIDVDERTSDTPDPRTDDTIVTGPPPGPDAGVDAPIRDAPRPDVPPDAPRDVPPDVPEDVVLM
jgi:hypothetical protein